MEANQNFKTTLLPFIFGILFTALIAIFGYILTLLPVFKTIGPMASAIILAIGYRKYFGYPNYFKIGIQFVARTLLRVAIVFYGLKLNINLIFQDGLGLLFKGGLVIGSSILLMVLIAKLLKADQNISFLVGVGTGICGAAAIAAVSPIIDAKEEDTAMSVGIIALIGTIFAVAYTVLRPLLSISEQTYGIWSGLSLHELAHVALAAAPAGEDALAIALLAKLSRVFLLIPVCFILILWIKTKRDKQNINVKVPFPLFLIGFILMSFLNSFVIGNLIHLNEQVLQTISSSTTFLLTMAMVGLGVNINLTELRQRALKPLLAVIITSLLLAIGTFFIS